MTLRTPAAQIATERQQRLRAALASLTDALAFVSRSIWPLVDLGIRVWLGKLALLASTLMSADMSVAAGMASNMYPMPETAILGAVAENWLLWGGAVSLIVGFATRFGASALCGFAVVSQLQGGATDLNLLWIAILSGYVLCGADRLSIDRLISKGLENASLPALDVVVRAFDEAKPRLTDIYLLLLRVWIACSLAIAGGHLVRQSLAAGHLARWLPLSSGAALFGVAALAVGGCIGFGFTTRLVAVLMIGVISYQKLMAHDMTFPAYWTALYLILVVRGPGAYSLDGIILEALKRWLPELSGKPAFALAGLPRVVIVGAGFGGIACARGLRRAPVEVTLVDRQNYHLFQPLLYQVATASLSPADIAIPIRSVFREQFNAKVVLANVTAIDTAHNELLADGLTIPFDYLVIATGATHSYFGKDGWAPFAPGLKRVDDATNIRRRILQSFELAETAGSDEERRHLLTFVIVGGGPTGVELAGAIAELARVGMEKDFRNFDPAEAKVILVQAAPRVLPAFPESLSEIARRSLETIGVTVLLDSMVSAIDAEGVVVNKQRIYARTVLWAAGVSASPAARWLDAEADAAGRVKVQPDLSVPNRPNIYVIGDTAAADCWQGRSVPGLAPAAKQGGLFVAGLIQRRLTGDTTSAKFEYRHLGSLATIGRKAAIADFGSIQFHGSVAWWLWGMVHVLFLFGFRNRISVVVNWLWSYVTYRASTRLIIGTGDGKAS